ncbi:hypothetical protein Scep_018559 [Stephania cephalantha]|uniref:Oxidation resistance protein 1 n=1 Tax=Stephania cephalantha TaxID=152367 RepID=A0AAP0NMA3_9MAGN
MAHESSLRSKAAHLVSDLTTVLLNPISDHENKLEMNRGEQESGTGEEAGFSDDGPDTSSFTAFLYSLLSSDSGVPNMENKGAHDVEIDESPPVLTSVGTSGRKTLFTRGKQSLGRVVRRAVWITGFKNQTLESRTSHNMGHAEGKDSKLLGLELRPLRTSEESLTQAPIPDISEPSLLLSEQTRNTINASLPALVQGRKWVLLYSTWRHGISLSTMYRRSMLLPGFGLLVVGDRKGVVFGGLVEAPLKPTNKRKYQGSNNSFVFSNASGQPVVFRPTGANRYFTLCSTDFLALGGGGHFALYLDGDLLNGSSSVSETFGNPCLAHSQDFEVKEVELWGFTYASKYEETIAFCRTEAPGICRW